METLLTGVRNDWTLEIPENSPCAPSLVDSRHRGLAAWLLWAGMSIAFSPQDAFYYWQRETLRTYLINIHIYTDGFDQISYNIFLKLLSEKKKSFFFFFLDLYIA